MSKHIVLTAWGSLGDLHPMLALALELQRRGHRATVASNSLYRAKVEEAGVAFQALRPVLPSDDDFEAIMQRAMNAKDGTEYLFRELLMPGLRDSYADLSALAPACDLLLTHPTQMAAPLVAQKFGLRWASLLLAPTSCFSVFDPPVLPTPIFSILRRFGQGGTRFFFRLMHLATRHWVEEVAVLRRELGLPPGAHPMFEGQYSPQLNLALFSRALGEPQNDWPTNTVQSGFLFYDTRGALKTPLAAASLASTPVGDNDNKLSAALTQFVEAGDAPLIFTLGSAAVMAPGVFFRESARAAQLLKRRAILLGDFQNAGEGDPNIASFDYAPYSQLFPRAAAIVHQGGVGTTAQAMRAGRPQLVVPHSHDQPDNAQRVTRRGLGSTLPLHLYQAPRVANKLRLLLHDIEYSKRAAQIGAQIQAENGAQKAADALENLLRAPSRR